MCLEERIHQEARREGMVLAEYHPRVTSVTPSFQHRSNTMPKRYKRLLIALAAVASLYLVRATGLDQGLIDEVLDAAIEAVVVEDAPAAAPELPAVAPDQE